MPIESGDSLPQAKAAKPPKPPKPEKPPKPVKEKAPKPENAPKPVKEKAPKPEKPPKPVKEKAPKPEKPAGEKKPFFAFSFGKKKEAAAPPAAAEEGTASDGNPTSTAPATPPVQDTGRPDEVTAVPGAVVNPPDTYAWTDDAAPTAADETLAPEEVVSASVPPAPGDFQDEPPAVAHSPLPTHPPVPEPAVIEEETAPGEAAPPSVTAPAAREARRGVRLLAIITAVLFLVVLGGVLAWHFTSRVMPQADSPQEVAEQYVGAMNAGDTITRQQLAAEDSKGHLPPPWFTVELITLQGTAQATGETATVPVQVQLTPPPDTSGKSTALATVLADPFTVTLHLQRESGEWRVDQQRFFADLRQQITAKNPAVVLPEK